MRISDWSSDVCSSDLLGGQYRANPSGGYGIRAGTGGAGISVGDLIINGVHFVIGSAGVRLDGPSDDKYRHSICITGCQFDAMTTNTMVLSRLALFHVFANNYQTGKDASLTRSEEHTSELQSLMRISYAVFCLQNKNIKHN